MASITDIEIEESGLKFVVDSQRVFQPEKEDFYQKLEGVKICDLILLTIQDNLLLIEVKSSAPQDNQEFVSEIRRKFVDSILVYVAAWANRANTQTNNLPGLLMQPTSLQKEMRLVLIVKNHRKEWLSPLREALQRECRSLERLFSLQATQVYNQELAREKLKLDVQD